MGHQFFNHTYWQFPDTLELHDVHFAAEMFCQVTVNPEGNHAVSALKWPGVISGGSPKCGVDVDFVEVTHRPLVFLQMALGAEAHRTGVTTERALKVVDVDVEPELGRLAEHLAADTAHTLTVLVHQGCILERESERERDR